MLQVSYLKSPLVSKLMFAVACLILAGFGQRVEAAAASKIQPEIIWNIPAPFVYGTMIPTAIVVDPANPTVDLVAAGIGQVTYTPALNTILHVTGQPVSLSAKFAPTGSANSRYNKADKTVSVTVTKAPLTVTANATKFYDEAPTAPLVSYSGFKFSDTVAVLTMIPSISHDVTRSSDAGSYTIRVGAGSANDYEVIPTNGIYEVKPAPLTLTLMNVQQVYNGSPRVVTVTTSPTAGIATSVLYDGSSTAPTNAGTYPILATVTNANYSGTVTGSLEITKAPVTITLSGLTQTYNGKQRVVTAKTSPSGKTVNITYEGAVTPPINAGSYEVIGTVSDTNYAGTSTATLLVKQATATVRLSGLTQTYNGYARNVTVTTSPVNLSHSLTYNGSDIAPINAGSYTVVGTITNPNYIGISTRTLVVRKARATVSVSDLRQTYNGNIREVSVSTVPANLAKTVTYAGLPIAPINAGSYRVVATVVDNNYSGSSSRTLVVRKATATVTLSNLLQVYNGDPREALAATNPTGLAVVITYNGQATAPINAGRYTVVGTINESNYQGRRTRTLVVQKAQATIVLSNLSQVFDYKSHAVSVVTDPSQLNVAVTYNNSVIEPIQVGAYPVLAQITDMNYVGSASSTLIIFARPRAVDDDATTSVNTPISVPVLANDTVASGVAQIVEYGQPTHGIVSMGGDGQSLVYSPNQEFIGSDSFTYTMSDDYGSVDLAIAFVKVQAPDDLVLHWTFDEKSGYIVQDNTRSENKEGELGYVGSLAGNLQEAAIHVPGKLGKCLSLNGEEYVISAANQGWQTQQFTVAIWINSNVKLSKMYAYTSLFNTLNYEGNSGYYFGTFGDSNDLHFMIMNGQSVEDRKILSFTEDSINEWVHLAVAYDGDKMQVYRNGVLLNSSQVGVLTINYSPDWQLRVGAQYNGKIDDFRMYSRALSVSELKAIAGTAPSNAAPVITISNNHQIVTLTELTNLTAELIDDTVPVNALHCSWIMLNGPAPVQIYQANASSTSVVFTKSGGYAFRIIVTDGDLYSFEDTYVTVYANDDLNQDLLAYWRLDEKEGAVAFDSSGNKIHLQLPNGSSWQTGTIEGAIELNGASYGISEDGLALHLDQFSITAWVFNSNQINQMNGQYPVILSNQVWEDNKGFHFGVLEPQTNSLGLRILTGIGIGDRIEVQAPVSEFGKWTHIAGVFDGVSLKIYIDGNMRVENKTGALRMNQSVYRLLFGHQMEGRMDDVRIYGRALNPSEVQTLKFNGLSGNS